MSVTLLQQVQAALARVAIDPGPVDNCQGPLTHQAISTYQRSNGMALTGRTSQTLVSELLGNGRFLPEKANIPIWLRHALSLRGTSEIGGPRHSKTIMG